MSIGSGLLSIDPISSIAPGRSQLCKELGARSGFTIKEPRALVDGEVRPSFSNESEACSVCFGEKSAVRQGFSLFDWVDDGLRLESVRGGSCER